MAEARKHKGEIIKTTYDEKGEPVKSEVLREPTKPSIISQKIKAIGGRLAVAAKGKKLTEEELDRQIRLTEKKARLARAKRSLSNHRTERIRASMNGLSNLMVNDLNGPRKAKRKGGVTSNDYFGTDRFLTAHGMEPNGGIDPNFNYADWTFGMTSSTKNQRKAKKSGNDILKDYYGM